MEAIGPVLIVVSFPLVMRWVPPNRLYGFRVPATHRDASVWYDANALCGRHLLLLGLLLVFLEVVLPLSIRNQTLRVFAVIGLVGIVIGDWRTANRWERQRRGGH